MKFDPEMEVAIKKLIKRSGVAAVIAAIKSCYTEEKKICSMCKELLPASAFYSRKIRRKKKYVKIKFKRYLDAYCIKCRKKINMRSRQKVEEELMIY